VRGLIAPDGDVHLARATTFVASLCRLRRKPDSVALSGFSAMGYRMNYRDDLSRLPSCYVTITVPIMLPGCSWQWYWNVPSDVKV
jgi:hypothetical protein